MSAPKLAAEQVLGRYDHLPIDVLAGLFKSTTNSYKPLLFLAILDWIERSEWSGYDDLVVEFDFLAAQMIRRAWHPVVTFRLSLGLSDQLLQLLIPYQGGGPTKVWGTSMGLDEYLFSPAGRELVSRTVPVVLRYAPFRLIRPFFRTETKNLPDARVDAAILRLAEGSENPALYRFIGTKASQVHALVLQEHWVPFLVENRALLRGWATDALVSYVSSRNPTNPGVREKLEPAQREALTGQRKLVRSWFEGGGGGSASFRCTYSGRPLPYSSRGFQLDHVIPWAFVAHDRMWNLVPVHPDVHKTKGTKLPARELLPKVARFHFDFADWLARTRPGSKWITEVENDVLRQRLREVASREAFEARYVQTVEALSRTAATYGFTGNWVPNAEAR